MNDPVLRRHRRCQGRIRCAIRPGGETFRFPNTAAGIRKLIARLSARNVALACMEATGGYEQQLALALDGAGHRVAIVNPRRMRRFADASGNIAKTDAIDARVIAHFAAGDGSPALAKARSRSGRDQGAGRAPGAADGAAHPREEPPGQGRERRHPPPDPLQHQMAHCNQIERLDKAIRDAIWGNRRLKSRYDLLLSCSRYGTGPGALADRFPA